MRNKIYRNGNGYIDLNDFKQIKKNRSQTKANKDKQIDKVQAFPLSCIFYNKFCYCPHREI